ncbi:NACHT domain-containing protein [Streptomyces sp. QHH-9511]|uniref:serine protease n=1 Tax=Streptomyces sp. QHH-9511 TaxID=2684468 RepID=UPI001318A062|nr:serine protease [Streptomyces sp. QHH-9511]QGZ49581.1 NACHT domain-containing protein [Streptomyces sp. QHH-9511]
MTRRPPGRGVVAVHSQRSGQQGSGVLLTDDTVLTCAHVLEAGFSAWASVPGRRDRVLCRVVWSDQQLDAALLQAPESLIPGTVTTLNTTTVRLGTVATERPLPDCEIVGFPRVQRYDEGRRLESDQYTGTVLPLAGLIRRTMVLELDRASVTERDDGASPLAGLSGAPVFAGSGLLGIVKEVPRGRGHRRVECVPLSAIVAGSGFTGAFVAATGGLPPALTAHTRHTSEDSPYEEEYAEALGAAYRRTKVFGLDELGRRASEWDLDTAYLSLEAATAKESGRAAMPQRVDDLLATRPRVLLRGDAGAGKTTLVWWLAAHAAAGTLGPNLAELNGLVPFVVPLRSLRARGAGFPSPAELPAAAGLVVDAAPAGWAGRVLAAGRGLLLVDGLDEVPPEDREAAHAWLSGLLARHPRTRCVATVRPLAVEPDWLGAEHFEELTLLPMRDQDVEAFVSAWHDAARLDGEDPEALRSLERDLLQQFRHNPSLSELARTPLLCAVICALHRLREGFLPETRWALYDSALQMLLGARDDRRRIDAPDGIRMSVEEHRQLLQRLAAWLVRGGQTEFTREQALHQLGRVLPGMPRVQAQGTTADVLTHLLNRSGLLQERTDDVFQFAHRTFQDFLAAKEFVEDDLLSELLRHAHEQQWHDVLLLAAGHCSRRELPALVEGLLAAGSATRKRDVKTTLYVLAALCAQHAAWLSETLHGRVRKAVTSVVPPLNREQVTQLARLGEYVLPLLPEPGGNPRSSGKVIELIASIGGARALPHAEAYARAGLAETIALHWEQFPTEEFADRVLSHLSPGGSLFLSRRDQLAVLGRLPQRRIAVAGGFSPAELVEGLGGRTLRDLTLAANPPLTDLDVLRHLDVRGLRYLSVQFCANLTDLRALTGLGALEELFLCSVPAGRPALEAVAGAPALRQLRLRDPQLDDGRLDLSPLHAVPDLNVVVSGVPRKNVLGRTAFGDRLLLEP